MVTSDSKDLNTDDQEPDTFAQCQKCFEWRAVPDSMVGGEDTFECHDTTNKVTECQ